MHPHPQHMLITLEWLSKLMVSVSWGLENFQEILKNEIRCFLGFWTVSWRSLEKSVAFNLLTTRLGVG